MAALFFSGFLADASIGLRTLDLRVLAGLMVVVTCTLLVLDWLTAWRSRLDIRGLAHLLENANPELAERLVSYVQLKAASTDTHLLRFLERETLQRLSHTRLDPIFPMQRERNRWLVSLLVLAGALVASSFSSAFGLYSLRLVRAWSAPLTPFELKLVQGTGHVLRAQSYTIEVECLQLDPYSPQPKECMLVCEVGGHLVRQLGMQPVAPHRFAITLENVRQSLRFHAKAGGVLSGSAELHVIDPPLLLETPALRVTPPKYLMQTPYDLSSNDDAIVRYSSIGVQFTLDQAPVAGWLVVDDSTGESKHVVAWSPNQLAGTCDLIASHEGAFEAKLHLELQHGLSFTLPVATWQVRDDRPPQFIESVRLQGQGDLAGTPLRIAPDDVLRLQITVIDAEGLAKVDFEYRINDEPVQVLPWLEAQGRKELKIQDWLPLPKSLKEHDRVRFRLRAHDLRRMAKGEVRAEPPVPAQNVEPHIVLAPASQGDDRWIELRVDRTIESFVKDQIQSQAAEVRDVIGAIKQKLQAESAQLAKVKASVHQRPFITQEITQEAVRLRGLNQEIVGDLAEAAQRLGKIDALANLAEYFLDIAETEMRQSDQALQRFTETERNQSERERELPIAQDAVLHAIQKLERMQELNRRLADDRLDQWQLDKLAHKQQELAERLKKLLDNPVNAVEQAKLIEELRAEQARLLAQATKMQEQSQLLQQSLATMQERRIQRLAKAAQELAQMQRTSSAQAPDKMPAAVAEQLSKLAKQQADFATRVKPFQPGSQASPARAAADALQQKNIENGIARQLDQERQLQEWIEKALPGVVPNAIHEQVTKLIAQQKKIRADLEQLGKDLPGLNEAMTHEKLAELVKRQRELKNTIAKLPLKSADKSARQAQEHAEQVAEEAANRLHNKDALSALESMRKTEEALQRLAVSLPRHLPRDPAQVKDAAERAKIEQAQNFRLEQQRLRKETEKLLADWAKLLGKEAGASAHAMTEKLAADLLELTQKGKSEAKSMAKDAASALEQAKKAMDAAQMMREKGDTKSANEMDNQAAQQLDIAARQLDKLAQEMSSKGMSKENSDQAAEALTQGQEQMRMAEKNLPAMPKDAQAAMKSAAQKLEEAAQQTGRQAERNTPRPPSRDPAQVNAKLAPGLGSQVPTAPTATPSLGRTWGQLPGELKTHLLQDFRARYGEDYAEIIQHYFERLAEIESNRKR